MPHCRQIVWGALIIFASAARAEEGVYGEQRISGWWDWLKNDVSQTWNQPQNYVLYLPFLSWYNRLTYDKEKTDNYNEMPWGGGFGLSRYHDDGDWSLLYTMMFKDSHNEWQPIVGYGWASCWSTKCCSVRSRRSTICEDSRN